MQMMIIIMIMIPSHDDLQSMRQECKKRPLDSNTKSQHFLMRDHDRRKRRDSGWCEITITRIEIISKGWIERRRTTPFFSSSSEASWEVLQRFSLILCSYATNKDEDKNEGMRVSLQPPVARINLRRRSRPSVFEETREKHSTARTDLPLFSSQNLIFYLKESEISYSCFTLFFGARISQQERWGMESLNKHRRRRWGHLMNKTTKPRKRG
jgi:hypothetical protein